MPLTRQFLIRELNRLPRERGLRLEEHFAWIRCCFHGRGQEQVPSLRINLDRSTQYRLGSFICFGCSERGEYNDLAKPLKIKRYKASAADNFTFEVPEHLRENLLGETPPRGELKAEVKYSPPWPCDLVWRTIPGWLLNKLDSRMIAAKFGERLYLPVAINKEIVGGITCALHDKASIKYLYDPGTWIRTALFPFDYTKRLLRRYQKRDAQYRSAIFLVEGPRDALRLLSFGLPALAILGGKTVWRQAKADLLLSLEPQTVILAFDPDEIGQAVTQLARDALAGYCQLQKLNFTVSRRNGEKIKHDPGNLPEWRAIRLRRQLNVPY